MTIEEEFESLWANAGSPPDVVLFFRNHRPENSQQWLSVLRIDQHRRWRTSSPLRVEDYLIALPELPAGIQWKLELAIGEYEARSRTSLPLSEAEISSRFSDISDTLRERIKQSSTYHPELVSRSTTDVGIDLHSEFPVDSQPDLIDAAENQVPVEQNDLVDSLATVAVHDWRLPPGLESLDRDSLTTLNYIFDLGTEAKHGRRYRLERLLGEGAFGSVYLGYDEELRRQVAVKVPATGRFATTQSAESYLTEARAVASLEHPNIVPVYDMGRTENGSVYVVSRFIEGATLETIIREGRPSHRDAAILLTTVAMALHHAHERRLIHRDVKPANILIEGATGVPFVADFGLAIREEESLAESVLAGTPAYMSPEQVRCESHRLDRRSDVFALGVIMYELLTGKRPFGGSSIQKTLRSVINDIPQPLRQWDSKISPELERVCLKALSKRASERYSTAALMANDLEAWIKSKDHLISGGHGKQITPRGLRSFTAEDAEFFLDLLPGPRNRDGLPESIAFWKDRIEQRDPDQTFTVGLLYGPSGCGKSSLVKAGLIPSLSADVIAIYVEATPGETEIRLLHTLRKGIPELPKNLELVESLALVRSSDGPKVVLILDQFEQWLYSHRLESAETLTGALRQCDGGRLQAILMIRDDFYLAAARLMNEIDVPIVSDQNFKLVDLFDADHAKNVLIRYGQAYGKFPENAGALSPQQDDFLRQVVEGLSEGGKVVSVRLALLAEMLKGRDWVPETLTTIGGLDGIGVSFLDETFASQRSDARLRQHQEAVRGVLRALLPETGTDIKGTMCAEEMLQEASGYANRPDAFHELMRILDGELRLVTPTDPEGSLKGEQRGEREADRSYISNFTLLTSHFQLTHDYLVPSLREWLTRKQWETKEGRAELRLAERAATWAANPEDKQLPTLWEWVTIHRLTEKLKWKPVEKTVMRRANAYHWQRLGLGALAMVLLAVGGIFAQREVSRRQELTRIEGLVGQLISAEPAQLPEIVKQLEENSQTASHLLAPLLEQSAETPDEKRTQLHARLASVGRDPSLIEPLVEELLTGKVAYIGPIRELLKPHASQLSDGFWQLLSDETAEANRRFRAGLALAEYSPPSESDTDTTSKSESDSPADLESKTWTQPLFSFMAEQLVSANAEFQPILRGLLRPIHHRLLPNLERVFGSDSSSEAQRLSAANAFADYAASDLDRLSSLLALATPEQFDVIYPLVAANPTAAVTDYLAEIAATVPPDDMGSVERVPFGQRRANAAVSLLRLGEPEKVLPVFNWTDDPEALTQFIFRCKPRGVGVETILDLLDRVAAVPDRYPRDARYALMLTVGEYSSGEIPESRRAALVERLADWYANDASSGVHGAAGWLLRQLGEHEIVTRVDQTLFPYSPDREWFTLAITVTPTQSPKPEENSPEKDKSLHTKADQQNEDATQTGTTDESETEITSDGSSQAIQQLDVIDSKTSDPDTSDESNSRSSKESPTMEADTPPLPTKTFYYTFIVFPAGEYTIGSPEDEPDRSHRTGEELRHQVKLTRPFAILDREVSFEELIAFEPQYEEDITRFQTEASSAGFGTDWYDSVAFCRWLGRQLDLDELDQPYQDPVTMDHHLYPKEPSPEANWAPRDWPVNLARTGFRLPTEAEWEIATRAGSRTAYGFGSAVGLLKHFGWFTENSGKSSHQSKELRPSTRGVFDLHGNVFEWVHDWYTEYVLSSQSDPARSKEGLERVNRGGGWLGLAEYCRSANRFADPPTFRTTFGGFRLAKSLRTETVEPEDKSHIP